MAAYAAEVKQIIGKHCYDTLKDAVDKGHLSQRQCVQFATQISLKVRTIVIEDIRKHDYDRHTIDTILGEWYCQHLGDIDNEISVDRIVNILRSPDGANKADDIALTSPQMDSTIMSYSDTMTNMETGRHTEEAMDFAQPLPDFGRNSQKRKSNVKGNNISSDTPERETILQEMKRGLKKGKDALWQHALRRSESERQKTERALRKSERERKEVIQENDNLADQLARMSIRKRRYTLSMFFSCINNFFSFVLSNTSHSQSPNNAIEYLNKQWSNISF